MPERKMGMAMGQDCSVLGEVCGWINAKATIPVWAKMTPNITDITQVGFLQQPFYANQISGYFSDLIVGIYNTVCDRALSFRLLKGL